MFRTMELQCCVHAKALRLREHSFEIYDNCGSAFVLELTNRDSGKVIQVGYVHHWLHPFIYLDSTNVYPERRAGLTGMCVRDQFDGCELDGRTVSTSFDSGLFVPLGVTKAEDISACIFDAIGRFHGLRLH